jgi:hypothetical protein
MAPRIGAYTLPPIQSPPSKIGASAAIASSTDSFTRVLPQRAELIARLEESESMRRALRGQRLVAKPSARRGRAVAREQQRAQADEAQCAAAGTP